VSRKKKRHRIAPDERDMCCVHQLTQSTCMVCFDRLQIIQHRSTSTRCRGAAWPTRRASELEIISWKSVL